MKTIFLYLLLGLLLSGCAATYTTSTITNPKGEVYTYHGPQDISMSVKEKDSEVTYSGKSQSWWSDMLKYLILMGSDVTVNK